MAQLTSLPDELLLKIACCIRSSDYSSEQSICNLALASRRFRPIAQEALHRHVRIPEPQWSEEAGPRRLGLLARTLVECPHLAQYVKVLDVHAVDRSSGHEQHCPVYDGTHDNGCNRYDRTKRCCCGYEAIEAPCEVYMLVHNTSNEEEVYPAKWFEYVYDGWEPSVCGFIISVCTALESLDMHVLRMFFPSTEGWVSWGQDCLMEMFFGGRENSYQSTATIAGLSTLKRLTTNTPLPWSMINLPELETLEVSLNDGDLDGAKRFVGRPADSLNTTITTLVVNVDLMTFARSSTLFYLDNIIPYLSKLRNLFVRLSTRDYLSREQDFTSLKRWMSLPNFGTLIGWLRNENLETLIIDISGVSTDLIMDDPDHGRQKFGRALKPVVGLSTPSLCNLPRLRRIMAPQEFFFSVNEWFNILRLPTSVESIQIVDATVALERWVDYIQENKEHGFPQLKEFVLWRQYQSEDIIEDPRLNTLNKYKRDNGDEEDVYETGSEKDYQTNEEAEAHEANEEGNVYDVDQERQDSWQWQFDDRPGVWDRLKSAGIDLVSKGSVAVPWEISDETFEQS